MDWKNKPMTSYSAKEEEFMMPCKNCGDPFRPTREHRKYCQPECRKTYEREQSGQRKRVTRQPRTREQLDTYNETRRQKYHSDTEERGKRLQIAARSRKRLGTRGVRDAQLQSVFGINVDEYDRILEYQEGGCAICGRSPSAEGKALAVDHNHDNGQVRGLLCQRCNFALGHMRDEPRLLRAAADYLESRRGATHPALRLVAQLDHARESISPYLVYSGELP